MANIKKVQRLPEDIVEHPHLRDATELDLSFANLIVLPERFGELNLTEINFGDCTALDLGVIFDVIFKFEGLTKLSLKGLEMESLPERKPSTTF